MSQDQVPTINVIDRSINNDLFNEGINDIRRAIEQYHNPIAYYISFGLDQAGVRLVAILPFQIKLPTVKERMDKAILWFNSKSIDFYCIRLQDHS